MTEDQEAETAEDEEDAPATDADAEAEAPEEETGAEEAEGEEQEAESEAEEAEEEAEEEGGIEHGDFVRLAYTARAVESGQLVDTTDEEVAREEGVDEGDRDFSPRVVVLGEGHLFAPVEEDIVGKEVGDGGEVVVPAAEAFGEYDREEVRTISADKIPEDDRYPGAHVNVEGEHGHVETIVGGRARVDFNHPLAGEDIEYEYEILDVVEDRVEQARGMLSMFVDADVDMWIETDEVEEEVTVYPDEDEEGDEDAEAEADEEEQTEADEDEEGEEEEEPPEPTTEVQTVEKETLYVEAGPQLMMNQQWMFSKQQIARQIIDRLGVDRMIVQETLGEGGGMMGGMMGGMGGMGGGVEEALEDADVDADEIVEELGEEP